MRVRLPAVPKSKRRVASFGTALLFVSLATGCGHGESQKARPTGSATVVSLADPADGITFTAPDGTEQITDPTQIADALTGVTNDGQVDPRVKIVAKKPNPHSYYPSSIELWVQPGVAAPADLTGQQSQISAEFAKAGASRITTRLVVVGGQSAIRIDYRIKGSEGQLSDGTKLLLWHSARLYAITVATNDTAPETGLADAVLGSVRFSA
jgi:hypothetical protein